MNEEYTTPELIELPALTDVTGVSNPTSDRAVKANFASVEGREVLERLVRMPISSWNYKAEDASIRHIGPMAQDFKATFEVGKDDKTIHVIDASGVALAAIQGLYQTLQEKDALLAEQQAKLEALETRLAALEQKKLA